MFTPNRGINSLALFNRVTQMRVGKLEFPKSYHPDITLINRVIHRDAMFGLRRGFPATKNAFDESVLGCSRSTYAPINFSGGLGQNERPLISDGEGDPALYDSDRRRRRRRSAPGHTGDAGPRTPGRNSVRVCASRSATPTPASSAAVVSRNPPETLGRSAPGASIEDDERGSGRNLNDRAPGPPPREVH